MKVRTLVVDDEPVARAGLRAMLTAFDWVEVVGEAADGEAAVEAIDRLRPELVFLDVQMPGLLGTEVLRRIERQPFIIFTTAFSQHTGILGVELLRELLAGFLRDLPQCIQV